MKLNVLGTEYEYIVTTEKEDEKLYGKDGYCDHCSKRIVVDSSIVEPSGDTCSNLNFFCSYVKRHETTHAFLWESGLEEYATDERLVNWISWQFPKLLEAFKAVDADA